MPTEIRWFVLPSYHPWPQSSPPWGALHTPWPWRRKSFVSLPQHVKDINELFIDGCTYVHICTPTCLARRCQGPKEINHFIRRTTIGFIKHQLRHRVTMPGISTRFLLLSPCSFWYLFVLKMTKPRFQVHTHLSNLYSGVIQLPKIGKRKGQNLQKLGRDHTDFVWN